MSARDTGMAGNEKADWLARQGSRTELVGPEPGLGVTGAPSMGWSWSGKNDSTTYGGRGPHAIMVTPDGGSK